MVGPTHAATWSLLGGLLVIGAGFNGASFLDFGGNISSLIMALLAFAAVACYVTAPYLAGNHAPAPPDPGSDVNAAQR
jgi:hypothetical protein